ncbi:N-terminal acetyltransferase A complex catalytic subunit ard1 [Tulasnella sp. 419]|nr:N-terminal acetyltransferase A complex catalytic subunit ard1 [Tulasnella sp. 418]KAG8967033.1 N-terminal acetyltransferase A complex catalytic subunit ard1 [Tulasnella sp. 419]
MNALYYTSPGEFTVKQVPIPECGDDEVLLKVTICGMCGTDTHIHNGEFIAQFPLIPGHEVVGTIAKVGKNVTGFTEGDRCVADNTGICGSCFYCRRGQGLYCESFKSKGVTMNGGFAEYCTFPFGNVYKIRNMTDEAATLVEPTSCAIHGMDRLNLPVGSDVLLIGGGPTGLMLVQLLRLNGAGRIVMAGNKGTKMDLAKSLNVADEYIELDRSNPEKQWEQLKADNPYGFDAVIEATGNEAVIDRSIQYVRRGGKLLVYGVYSNEDRVHWSPAQIFKDEIEIIGSFAQVYCFPRAVAYLDSGKLKTDGLVTHSFGINEWQKAMDTMASRQAIKISIKPA